MEEQVLQPKNSGRIVIQIWGSFIASMPIFLYGLAMTWISPYEALLKGEAAEGSPSSPPLTDEDLSWMAALLYFPGPVTVFVYGLTVDKFGRKVALVLCSVPTAIGWSIPLVWATPPGFILARALVGFGAGGAFTVCPLYVKEISQDAIRGFTGSFLCLSLTFGNLLMFVLTDVVSFYSILWIMVSLPVIHIALQLWLPDSPSFLLEKGKIEEATKTIAWFRSLHPNDPRVQTDLEALLKEKKRGSPKFAPKLLFADKITAKAFFIVIGVCGLRELNGSLAVLTLAGGIFGAAGKVPGAGLTLSPNQQGILLALAQCIGASVSGQIVDRAGRKPLLLITIAAQAICLSIISIWFFLAASGLYFPGWVPIAALSVGIVFDAAGVQPIAYIITTEMFHFNIRATASIVLMSSLFFVDFAQLKIITVLLPVIGYSYLFLFFVFISIIFFIFTIFYVIETKIRTVDEIYEDLKTHGKSSRKTVESRAQTDVLLKEFNTLVVKPLACKENSEQNELLFTEKLNN
ncbi:facilitated trehalose transporter Tret1 [Plutella xylostella]|uniref:facilitated trehalose transporter Tret1 n=1 Tax=Plutella xylostella TaxID=51655 RepID=UPI002032FF23|nr:facilitated trehalose transporter Tret1 [Plutella xylostella]